MKQLLAVGIAALILTGCMDVDTTIRLGRDGSGRIDLVYSIDSELYHLGVFDDSDTALPIPVSREEFSRTADSIDGLRLRRYRLREDVGLVTISVRLVFDSVNALNAWYGGGSPAISLTESADGSAWRQTIVPGSGGDGPLAQSLGESLAGSMLTFTLQPPSPVIRANLGEISSDQKRVSASISLEELVLSKAPLIWKVKW